MRSCKSYYCMKKINNMLSFGIAPLKEGHLVLASALQRITSIVRYSYIPTYKYGKLGKNERIACLSRDLLSHIGHQRWPVGVILDKDVLQKQNKIIKIDAYNIGFNDVHINGVDHILDAENKEHFRVLFSGQIGKDGSVAYCSKEYADKVANAILEYNRCHEEIATAKNFSIELGHYMPKKQWLCDSMAYRTQRGVRIGELALNKDEFKRIAGICEAEERIVTSKKDVDISKALVAIVLPEKYQKVFFDEKRHGLKTEDEYLEVLSLVHTLKDLDLLKKVVFYNEKSTNFDIIRQIGGDK